jgi:peptidoglycan lytic transglycosylase G
LRRAFLVLLLLAVSAAGLWWHETRFPVRTASQPPQILVVEPGQGALGVGASLQALGLVRHPQVFRWHVALRGDDARLRTGEYELKGELSLDQIADLLVSGDVVRHTVTFPEGKDLEETVALAAAAGLDKEAFRAAVKSPSLVRDLDPEATDLEGYLFPDTYDVTRRPDAAVVLVQRMVQRFRDALKLEAGALTASGRDLRDVVTLASVVEKETARGDERPRIAAVFLNRIRLGMPLQTDPTVIYALRRAGRYDGNIRRADLEIDSPYNTYRYAGLPPGPIASPGLLALKAALHPEPVDDLYFVSRNDGSHYFSRTLAEHARAVDHYQRGRGAPPPADRGRGGTR